jgi:uncharacterized protein
MRALLLLAVVLVGVWFWRQRQGHAQKPVPPPEPSVPLDMVRCAHCGLHITAPEAVPGKRGQYCSQEHLQLAET